MRRFGGSVEIESSPGMGTVVRLILPAVSEDVPSGKRVAVQTKVSAANILLVDDDPRVLDVVGELLSLDGHAVSRFRSAGEALAWLEGGARPDLIITDLGMPEMDGNSFAKASKHSFPDIPIVMMTGWRKLLGATERSPDIDVYVSKPPTLESLRSVISEAQSIGAVIKRSEP
jgi:CheY-like chemotaxis protein